jgi:hypothetical protein
MFESVKAFFAGLRAKLQIAQDKLENEKMGNHEPETVIVKDEPVPIVVVPEVVEPLPVAIPEPVVTPVKPVAKPKPKAKPQQRAAKPKATPAKSPVKTAPAKTAPAKSVQHKPTPKVKK